jgi:hypothetical protein
MLLVTYATEIGISQHYIVQYTAHRLHMDVFTVRCKIFRIDGDFWDTEIQCPKNSRLVEPTDMTIHWKALEKHFLMVPVVQVNHIWGKCIFWIFLSENQLKSIHCDLFPLTSPQGASWAMLQCTIGIFSATYWYLENINLAHLCCD